MEQLTLKSPAKINLFLDVLKKRNDGYHEIRTLMQAIDLYDELVLQKAEKKIGISCDHPGCPADERNLAFKAASLLFEQEDIKGGIDIHIKKRIPISAGLGGGSSNAASTLMGISKLLDLDVPVDRLHHIAAKVGSDVPFFLYSGQSLAEGRGEEIKQMNMYRDYWLVLLCPKFEVSTGWAYGNVKISLTSRKEEVNYSSLESKESFFRALPLFRNDLEEAVAGRYTVILELKDILKSYGAVNSSMSGSGPTIYGVFDQQPQAQEVAVRLSRGDWQVFLTQPIPASI